MNLLAVTSPTKGPRYYIDGRRTTHHKFDMARKQAIIDGRYSASFTRSRVDDNGNVTRYNYFSA